MCLVFHSTYKLFESGRRFLQILWFTCLHFPNQKWVPSEIKNLFKVMLWPRGGGKTSPYSYPHPGLLTPDPVSYFSVSSPVKSGFLSDLSAYVTQPLTQCIETLWSHRNVLTLAKWRLVGKIMKSLRELMRRLSVKLGNGQEGPRSRDLKKHHQTPTVSGSQPKSQSEGQAFCWRGWNHLLSFG